MSDHKNGNDRDPRRAVHDEPDKSRKGPGNDPAPKRHLRPLPRPWIARPVHYDDHGGAAIRRLMTDAFLKSRPAVMAALQRRFANPKTVQSCLELLARLKGKLP